MQKLTQKQVKTSIEKYKPYTGESDLYIDVGYGPKYDQDKVINKYIVTKILKKPKFVMIAFFNTIQECEQWIGEREIDATNRGLPNQHVYTILEIGEE